MIRNLCIALAAASLGMGCPGDTETTDDTDVDSDTAAPAARLVNVTGTTTNLLTGAAAPEGLCATAVEPTLALDGGELTVLGQAVVDADGKYDIKDVDLDQAPLAIFVVIDDCPDSTEDTVFPTGTGLASDSYADNVAGDTLNRDPFWFDNETAAGMNQSFALAGSEKTTADGVVIMFVLDEQGAPLPGATVSCAGEGCDTLEAYYLDGDPTDGLFTTEGSVNAATVAGIAALPGGPVGNYTATAEGKTFSSSLFGSIPGLAAVTAISAE